MNPKHGLQRELAAWFAETATPRTPDWTDELIARVVASRQRPRWSFAGRWLPSLGVPRARPFSVSIQWHWIGLLLLLTIAILGAFLLAGSRPRLPAPFGPAANGVVAYDTGGDIYTVDPETVVRSAVMTGPTNDHDPRFSPDGRLLAFMRDTPAGTVLAVMDVNRPNEVISITRPFAEIDDDGIQWSPDCGSIALSTSRDGTTSLFLVDVASGDARRLELNYLVREVYWRPPDGHQLLFLGQGSRGAGLYLVSLADGMARQLGTTDSGTAGVRALGWTPDGERFAYLRDDDPSTTRILDVETGTESVLDLAFGQLSNDGHQIFGIDGTRVCVGTTDGGPCRSLGDGSLLYEGSWHEGVFWSPDDRWIVVHPANQPRAPLLVDAISGRVERAPWISGGAESWQRLAP